MTKKSRKKATVVFFVEASNVSNKSPASNKTHWQPSCNNVSLLIEKNPYINDFLCCYLRLKKQQKNM